MCKERCIYAVLFEAPPTPRGPLLQGRNCKDRGLQRYTRSSGGIAENACMNRYAQALPFASQPDTDARELGLKPTTELGKIDAQEPWKLPLRQFIEQLYFERASAK
jgi:hypothetical protein